MSAKPLNRSLEFNGVHLNLYELNGKVWLLGSDIGGIIKRDAGYLVRQSPKLFTSKLAMKCCIANADGSVDKYYRKQRRLMLSITGARMAAAAGASLLGMDLFHMLASLDDEGKPRK